MSSDIEQVVTNYREAEAALQALLRRADELEGAQITVQGARASLTEAADRLLASERALVDGTSSLVSLAKELATTGDRFKGVAEKLGELDQASLLEVNEQTQASIHEVGTAVRIGLTDLKTDVTTGTSAAADLSELVRRSVEAQESALVEVRSSVADLRDRILGLEGRIGEVGGRVGDLGTRLSQVQDKASQMGAAVDEIGTSVGNMEKRLVLALVLVAVAAAILAASVPIMM